MVKLSYSILLAGLSISPFIGPQKARANLFRINIVESGADVLFSFDGSIDTSDATIEQQGGGGNKPYSITQRFRSGIVPFIEMGGTNNLLRSGTVLNYDFGTGVNLPIFGTSNDQIDSNDGYTITGSGDPLKISQDSVFLSEDYVSGSNISGDMRFLNTSFAGLSITPGTYSYTLGNNNMEIVATPGPLPILGLPVLFFYYRKLKHNSRLSVGAKGAPIGASNSKL